MQDEPSGTASTARDERNTINDDPQAALNRATRDRRQRNRLLFNKKREHFLKDYLRNLDVLIYAELAAVYYMDCSFIRFIIRALVQFMLLTPKPQFIPEPPQNRPYIGAIFGTNLLCLFLHIYNAAPSAGEQTRGYLHGGLAMDFIGQKGPTSKLHLVFLDFLLLGLQLVALGTHLTREKVKKQATTPPSASAAPAAAVAPTQDLDHEERGLRRSDHDPVDIELQNLNPSGGQVESEPVSTGQEEGNEEREALLASSMPPRTDAHLFDAFNSGEIMIAALDISALVITQYRESQDVPSEVTTSPPGSTLSERLARGGLGFRIRIGDRILGV